MNTIKTADKAPRSFRSEQKRFQRSRKAELEYARKLRSIAKQVGNIVSGLAPNGVVKNREQLIKALNAYAAMIEPWARSVAQRMVDDIARRDLTMWSDMGADIGRNLRDEIENGDTGEILRASLEAQVHLITSLPREAAQRVHKLTLEGLMDSTRASEISKEIMKSGEVTKSRANLIARTEVARTASELTASRSTKIGITHYVWRTSGDSDVRESHKHMNGKVIEFKVPPEVEPGKYYHAGQFPNCRCYMEVIIPEEE
jgi:SPP1 gp7 family putative phage head morphogenesis protein